MIPVLDGVDLIVPDGLDDALRILASDSAVRPFAGGTDLMVLLEAGHLSPGSYVSLWGLRELRGISRDDHGRLMINALTTFSEIRESAAIARAYPMLQIAAAQIGGIATQNRATIGGNIANASPAADSPPALLAYDAEIELLSARGRRRVPYAGFHTAYKKTRLEPGEIVASVVLPPREQGWRDGYRKVGTRRAQAISKVCLAASVLMDGDRVADARFALGSVAATVVRCRAAEDAVRRQAIDQGVIARTAHAVLSDIRPIDDIRSTSEYRRAVAQNLITAFLSSVPPSVIFSPARSR
jgi:CO/xanthine dehydrogenase FAD-binding subunit